MAQSGGARKREYKDILFSRKVVLLKNDNECTSFSDMKKIESKSEIEFSSSMTQNDVQKKIQETFPYLEHKRYSCAAFVKVDNDHKKFEFFGSRRVWDGKTIKKQIKGKSNLYILEEEVVHSTSTCTVTHDSNSTESEDNNNADARLNSSASDTGFDEGMEIDHAQQHEYWRSGQTDIMSGNTETLDDIYGEALLCKISHMGEVVDYQQDSTDVTMSAAHEAQVSGEYSRTSVEELAASRTSEEDLSQNHMIDADLPLEATMDPPRVPLQGGGLHKFDFKSVLPPRVQSGSAFYGDLGNREFGRLNNSLIGWSIPPKKEPGWVLVKLYSQSNEYLGEARLFYFDEKKEWVKNVAQDENLLRDLFSTLAISYGTKPENSRSEPQNSGNLEGKHSGSTRALQVLQLLVYAAAECGAQQCIKIILNSSAGKGVFDTYKDSSPLPEVIARKHGHEEIAHYLEDITTRFGNEKTICPEGPQTIDWAELVAAADAAQEQRELSITSGEENRQVKSDETSDTDYFGDAETSSSDSSQLSRSDSEDADSEILFEGSVEEGEIQLKANVLEKHTDGKRMSSLDFSDANIHREGLCTIDGEFSQEPVEKPVMVEEGAPNQKLLKKGGQLDNEEYKESVSSCGFTHSLSEGLSKWRNREDTSRIQENTCLKEEDKKESSSFQRLTRRINYFFGLFGKGDGPTEAINIIKTTTAKPKVAVTLVIILFLLWNSCCLQLAEIVFGEDHISYLLTRDYVTSVFFVLLALLTSLFYKLQPKVCCEITRSIFPLHYDTFFYENDEHQVKEQLDSGECGRRNRFVLASRNIGVALVIVVLLHGTVVAFTWLMVETVRRENQIHLLVAATVCLTFFVLLSLLLSSLWCKLQPKVRSEITMSVFPSHSRWKEILDIGDAGQLRTIIVYYAVYAVIIILWWYIGSYLFVKFVYSFIECPTPRSFASLWFCGTIVLCNVSFLWLSTNVKCLVKEILDSGDNYDRLCLL